MISDPLLVQRERGKQFRLLPTSRPVWCDSPAIRISSTTSRSWLTLIGKRCDNSPVLVLEIAGEGGAIAARGAGGCPARISSGVRRLRSRASSMISARRMVAPPLSGRGRATTLPSSSMSKKQAPAVDVVRPLQFPRWTSCPLLTRRGLSWHPARDALYERRSDFKREPHAGSFTVFRARNHHRPMIGAAPVWDNRYG